MIKKDEVRKFCHTINNEISVISGYLELLELDGIENEFIKNTIEAIQKLQIKNIEFQSKVRNGEFDG